MLNSIRRYPVLLLGCLLATVAFWLIARAHGADPHTVNAADSINAGRLKMNSNFVAHANALTNPPAGLTYTNPTLSGFVTLTNANGVTLASIAITNLGGNVTNLFTVPIPDSRAATIRVFATFYNASVPASGGFDQLCSFINSAGSLGVSGGVSNIYAQTSSGIGTNGFFVSGTNVIIRCYNANTPTSWRARLEVLHSPP